MNDLDKRIAELKGLRIDWMLGNGKGILEMGLEVVPGSRCFEPTAPWSVSDAKALELVDELTLPKDALPFEFDFTLGFSRYDGNRWRACFTPIGHRLGCHAGASTRPEAICRAYIAAREWVATKAGA